MLKSLLVSGSNVFEGTLDGYEVVLNAYMRCKDKDPDTIATEILLQVGTALNTKPQLRRLLALCCASLIAWEQFGNGEDYAIAMNRARNQCLKAVESPLFFLEVYKLYEQKRGPIVALVSKVQAQFDEIETDEEALAVLFSAGRELLVIFRSDIQAAAA